jgi:hypothetical protein
MRWRRNRANLALVALAASACGRSPLDLGTSEDAGAPAVTRRSIYVATSQGLERVAPGGGALESFGGSDDTVGVFVSPDGSLVAQLLALGYVAVFDTVGASRGAIDAPVQMLGWSDSENLIGLWPAGGKFVEFGLSGQTRDADIPLESGEGFFGAASMSPRGHFIAATANGGMPATRDPHGVVVLLSPKGQLIASLGVATAGPLAWTGDELLAFQGESGNELVLVAPPAATPRRVQLQGAQIPCGFASWYTPGHVLGGDDGQGNHCAPVVIDVETGTTSGPAPAAAIDVSSPPFALSADGRDVALASGSELLVGPADGSAFRSLGYARAPIVAVAW